MQVLVQTVALGILIGGIYALLATGLSLIFGVMRLVSFAHGTLAMIGGMAAYYTAASAGMPPAMALVAAMAGGAALGFGIDSLLLRQVHAGRVKRAGDYTFIITFAVSLFVTAGAIALFGANDRRYAGFWPRNLALGEWVRVSGDRVVAFSVAAVLTAILFWIVYRTDLGRGWRAMTQSPSGARVVGVDVVRLSNLAWVTGGALAGAAGALLTPLYTINPGSGSIWLVKAFIVVVIGGLGSIGGAFIGGILLGLIEVFGSAYVSSIYQDAYGFGLMIAVLLLWPRGLLGREARAL